MLKCEARDPFVHPRLVLSTAPRPDEISPRSQGASLYTPELTQLSGNLSHFRRQPDCAGKEPVPINLLAVGYRDGKCNG